MNIVNLLPYAASGMIDQLKAAADIIEQVDANNTYFGFISKGTDNATTDKAAPKWSILKITTTGESPAAVVTSFLWASGLCSYNFVWNDRATYTYLFKKF